MSKEVLFAKLLSMYLWDVKQQIITFEDILSLTDSISDEAFKYVEEAESWLKEIEKHIKIIDTPITPQQCSIVLRMWNEKFGSFEKMANNQESYTHNKGCENLFKIVITDHVKLAKDNGKGTKNTIDELCSEYIYYRNKCNITGFLIQQANRQSKSTERRLNNMSLLQLDDLSDSSGTAQASEVVIGLYFPFREKLNKLDGYKINLLKDRYRCIQVLKNRYGKSDVNISIGFYGECGIFRELPLAEDIVNYQELETLDGKVKIIKEEPKKEYTGGFVLG